MSVVLLSAGFPVNRFLLNDALYEAHDRKVTNGSANLK